MKCKSCGADINPKSTRCEYCGSYVENVQNNIPHRMMGEGTNREQKTKLAETAIRAVSKIIIAWIAIWAILIVVVLMIVLNSDLAKSARENRETSSLGYGASQTKVLTCLPPDEKGLTGTIVRYEGGECASVEYEGSRIEEVKILDKKLTNWLTKNHHKLWDQEIYFDTDAEGNIKQIGFLTDCVTIIDRHGNDYVGIRRDQILCFSADGVKVGEAYTGYFTYPDMYLLEHEKQTPYSIALMDPTCEGKDTETRLSIYSEKEIKLYQICVSGEWYYCGKDVYDGIQEGDKLDAYEFYLDPYVILAK